MTFSVFLTISGLNKEGEIRMKRLLLAVITLSTLCVKAGKSAESTTPQFYAGVSVGHDHMTAKRTEKVVTTVGTQLSFSNNKTQKTNGVNGKVIAGFLWRVPNTQFVLSPEVYIGHGSGQITLQESGHDLITVSDRSYQSTFKQSLALGIVLRAGFYLTGDNNFLYGLIGIDRSKFENKFTLSSTDLLVPIPTFFEKRSKFLKSTIFGIGFERKFNTFKVGIDSRYMPYSEWNNYSKTVATSNDKITVRFRPKIFSTSLTFAYIF